MTLLLGLLSVETTNHLSRVNCNQDQTRKSRNEGAMRKLLVLLALAAGLMTVGGNQAQAADVACGDVLTATTKLHEDLNCLGVGAGQSALTIDADGIKLDCRGYTVTGNALGRGIFVDGRDGVTVKNCYVDNFGIGIFLDSSSGSFIKRNVVTGATAVGSGAIELFSNSDGNVLVGNVAEDNAGRGFELLSDSNGNRLVNNTAIGNGFRGFDIILSDWNHLVNNTAIDNLSAGFVVQGSTGNKLNGNESSDNSSEGFAIFSSGNKLTGNLAEDNGTYGYTDSTGPANDYKGNKCGGNNLGGSLPSGLCKPQ